MVASSSLERARKIGTVSIRLRMSTHDAHYAGELVDGAPVCDDRDPGGSAVGVCDLHRKTLRTQELHELATHLAGTADHH